MTTLEKWLFAAVFVLLGFTMFNISQVDTKLNQFSKMQLDLDSGMMASIDALNGQK